MSSLLAAHQRMKGLFVPGIVCIRYDTRSWIHDIENWTGLKINTTAERARHSVVRTDRDMVQPIPFQRMTRDTVMTHAIRFSVNENMTMDTERVLQYVFCGGVQIEIFDVYART